MPEGVASDITSDSSNTALAAISNRRIKKYGGKKLRRIFQKKLNIFGTQCFAQFLWYARTYYVRVAAQFLYLLVSGGALPLFPLSNYLPEMTSVDLDKVLVPIRNELIKRNGGQIASILLKYFRHSFFDAILVVCLATSCGSCI